jgi:hypothetical protein
MRVIVGKPRMQTPAMAGYIRYVTLNPWWNVPPDLARERAKRVLKSRARASSSARIWNCCPTGATVRGSFPRRR